MEYTIKGIVKLLEKLKRNPSYVSPMVTAMQPPEVPLPHSKLQKPEFEVSDNDKLAEDAVHGERDCCRGLEPKETAVPVLGI
jgi:hypothetical protein